MTEKNISPDNPTIQNLVNSVFFVFNNPSRSYNSTSQLHHLIRQFCLIFGEEEKTKILFRIWKGGKKGVGTARLEFKVLQKITNPLSEVILTIDGKKKTTGFLNELLEVRRMKMLDIFTEICAEHAIEVPVQWDKFQPSKEKGDLPVLGAD